MLLASGVVFLEYLLYVLLERRPSSQADKSRGHIRQPSPIRHWAVVFPLCLYSADKRRDSGVCPPCVAVVTSWPFFFWNANLIPHYFMFSGHPHSLHKLTGVFSCCFVVLVFFFFFSSCGASVWSVLCTNQPTDWLTDEAWQLLKYRWSAEWHSFTLATVVSSEEVEEVAEWNWPCCLSSTGI